MAVITVLGAGMMGSALCVPLIDAGHTVRLVGTHLDGAIVDGLRASGRHPKLDLELPRTLEVFAVDELDRAMRGVEVIGIGVSSAGVRWAGDRIAPWATPAIPIVMISKGLEWSGSELRVLPDVLSERLPEAVRSRVFPAAVGGPCIAGELARRVETCVVVAGRERASLERLRNVLKTSYYHPSISTDVVGVEVGAALKNAYAMGVAFALGLHEKNGGVPGSVAMHNYESAVFAQSVLEMQRIAELAGGNPASVAGLAGAGDLDVTTNGGRTGRFGRLLGLGLGVKGAIEAMGGATLECLEILAVMRQALPPLEARGVLASGELPLLGHLCEVALDDRPVAVPFDRFFGG